MSRDFKSHSILWWSVTGPLLRSGSVKLLLASVLMLLPLHAPSWARETVTVSIRVAPVAQVDFPAGTGFELHIPDKGKGRAPMRAGPPPHIDTAQIPFTIKGNTPVVVLAVPGAILQEDQDGTIGRAWPVPGGGASGDAALGYRLRLEFPLGVPKNPLAGLGNGRGKNPTRSDSMKGDPSQGSLSGIIHVIPDVHWGDVASGKFDDPGIYSGSVQLIISTD